METGLISVKVVHTGKLHLLLVHGDMIRKEAFFFDIRSYMDQL